jgi:hypothetical protein
MKTFDWFKKPDYSNVLKFPEQIKVPSMPYVEPLKEKDPTIHYTIGHTDDNRIAFRIGYSTLTMNHVGVQQLIDQLELYKNQLYIEEDNA